MRRVRGKGPQVFFARSARLPFEEGIFGFHTVLLFLNIIKKEASHARCKGRFGRACNRRMKNEEKSLT
jgi:hypothetical protein